ncbi:collagen alpha-1(XI) chain-like isoform X2 [Moschus berezovskii]|uniref:collagen alpha-1(XI) chain-like isoform X2 n=1 Tax=Moschus berezovskii TaxID=68408 RepID=UPI0024452D5A|nr:collagen alpha-1(XI) chain-like isoform X2 [Moschus berezovskii]
MPVTKRDGLARRWGRVFSGVEHVIGDASRKRWAGMRCSAGSGGRAVEASERGRPRGRSGRGSKHGNGPPASHPRPPFRCGPLGGDLAQALLFSRTAYDCSPQCLLPASPLEVKMEDLKPGGEHSIQRPCHLSPLPPCNPSSPPGPRGAPAAQPPPGGALEITCQNEMLCHAPVEF